MMMRMDDHPRGPVGPVDVADPPVGLVPETPEHEHGGGGDDRDGLHLYVSVTVFGEHKSVELFFPDGLSDERLAEEMWGAVGAVAAMRGMPVWWALQQQCANLTR